MCVQDKIVVHLVCPICQTSYPHLESRAHLSQCLHDVSHNQLHVHVYKMCVQVQRHVFITGTIIVKCVQWNLFIAVSHGTELHVQYILDYLNT